MGQPSVEGGSQGDGKQMFGKQMLAGPTLTMGHREGFDQQRALLASSLSVTTGSCQTMAVCDDSSLPGTGPPSKFL